MRIRTRSAFALSPVLCLFAAPIGRDQVSFGPEAGTTLSKTYRIEGTMELDHLSILVDGQDVLEMLGGVEMTFDLGYEVVLLDTYDALEDGRLTRLTRTYDTISTESETRFDAGTGAESTITSGEGELEGETVVFTWDPDDESYSVELAEEGSADLGGLEADADLRFLLPDDEVDEGDTWWVSVLGFREVFVPGGILAFDEAESEEIPPELQETLDLLGEQFVSEVEELFDGSCECTYLGRDDEGFAVIGFSTALDSAIDLADILETILSTMANETGQDIPVSIEFADLSFELEAEGVLLWDVDGGHAHSLELTTDGSYALDIALSADLMNETQSSEISAELSLHLEEAVRFE